MPYSGTSRMLVNTPIPLKPAESPDPAVGEAGPGSAQGAQEHIGWPHDPKLSGQQFSS